MKYIRANIVSFNKNRYVMEVTGINSRSVLKLGLLTGLLMGIPCAIFIMAFGVMSGKLGPGTVLLLGLLAAAIMALASGVAYALSAEIYGLAARLVGGVRYHVELTSAERTEEIADGE